ncbi:hypothetical protein J2T08_000334 [Neorhizobium galegae]|uniref:hypothetical protein n=1 Tax=Neorhizobium galegae TaxID=399 RepID=UPI002786BEE6|nr:hypothetical protein [Neorhizobium galegae]MDQ0132433.1 hypothetical protein [Neorhizobium galegae]
MDEQKSRAALLEFLDYLARKGLMNKTTASARKAAVNNVLGILDDHEATDISSIDLDDVMRRFENLNRMNYTADSLTTYKSRVRSAIEDFLSYIENPMAFRPSKGNAGRKVQERSRAADSKLLKDGGGPRAQVTGLDFKPPPPVASLVLPIPIRADLTVYVQGLPYDLTQSEASKIANVIRAMAAGDDF